MRYWTLILMTAPVGLSGGLQRQSGAAAIRSGALTPETSTRSAAGDENC